MLDQLAKRNELPSTVLPELRSIFAGMVPISTWKVLGPFPIEGGARLDPDKPIETSATFEGVAGKRVTWKTARAVDKNGQIDLGRFYNHDDDRAAYGYAEITSEVERTAQFVVGSDDTLTVWVNGKQVYDFSDRRGFSADARRFDVELTSGRQPHLDSLWQSRWTLAVLGGRHECGRLRFLESPAGMRLRPGGLSRVALKGRVTRRGASSYSAI